MRDHSGRFFLNSLLCAISAVAIGSRLACGQQPRQPMKQAPAVNKDARTDAYGDPLPPGALARTGTLRDYIGEGSSRVIFSADGKFVTASSEWFRPEVRLWDPASGRVVRDFPDVERSRIIPRQVAISPDVARIAVADYSVVWIGDVATGQRIRLVVGLDRIWDIAFSTDSKILLVRDNDTVLFWDVATGKQTHWPSLAGYRPFWFTHDFEVVGSGRSGGDPTLRFGLSGREIHGRGGRVLSYRLPVPLAVSPDHRLMASFGRHHTITLWNLVTGRPVRSVPNYRHPPGLIIEPLEDQLAFSPDGKLLAGYDALTSLALWDVATGRLYRRFHGPLIEMGLAFAPDGKRVVTGGRQFHYWDIKRGQEIHRLPDRPEVIAVAFTPDAKTLVTAAGLRLRLWDAATGREIQRFQSPHRFRELLYPLDSGTGKEDRRVGGTKPILRSLAITPDGQTIATGAEDGSLWLWDVANGQAIREILDMNGSVGSIAFAPDGETFAAADEGGHYLADAKTGRGIHRFPGPARGEINAIAFSPDGEILASANDHDLTLWRIKDRAVWKKLLHPDGSLSVAFTPDGKTLATGDINGEIRIWDLESGVRLNKFMREFRRDEELPQMLSLVFMRDGKTLISASDDSNVKLWDIETGRELWRLRGHGAAVNSLALAPGGKTLASGSDDGTAVIWDLTTVRPEMRVKSR